MKKKKRWNTLGCQCAQFLWIVFFFSRICSNYVKKNDTSCSFMPARVECVVKCVCVWMCCVFHVSFCSMLVGNGSDLIPTKKGGGGLHLSSVLWCVCVCVCQSWVCVCAKIINLETHQQNQIWHRSFFFFFFVCLFVFFFIWVFTKMLLSFNIKRNFH